MFTQCKKFGHVRRTTNICPSDFCRTPGLSTAPSLRERRNPMRGAGFAQCRPWSVSVTEEGAWAPHVSRRTAASGSLVCPVSPGHTGKTGRRTTGSRSEATASRECSRGRTGRGRPAPSGRGVRRPAPWWPRSPGTEARSSASPGFSPWGLWKGQRAEAGHGG